MVKEFGQYLEELVKDYLLIVKKFDLADIEYPYQFKRKIQHKHVSRSIYPSDIDVIGIKGSAVFFIECREKIKTKKKWLEDIEELKRAKENTNFKESDVKIAIAFADYPSDKKKKEIQDFASKNHVMILYLKEMLEELIEQIREMKKQRKRLTYGRYAWMLKYMYKLKLIK